MKLDKLKYFVFGSAILLLTPSCNKYLDTNPDNRTEINSVDKVAQLVGTAYPAYDYLTFTEAASDNRVLVLLQISPAALISGRM